MPIRGQPLQRLRIFVYGSCVLWGDGARTTRRKLPVDGVSVGRRQ